MSSLAISSFADASQKVIIYCGIPILIAGVTGSLFNVIIFRSNKSFRRSSCIFYLTIMSIVNIGQLVTGLFSQIMINGFNIDWTQSSVFYCKFRWFCLGVCALISFTCMCFATIDQFLATCLSRRWQKWSNIKIAHIVTTIFIGIWSIYGIPYLVYYNLIVLPSTGKLVCIATDRIFHQYYSYSSIMFLGGFLPILIDALFGFLLYCNVQWSYRRTLPLIRCELDRQLTVIAFVQIIYNFIAIVPFLIVTILVVNLMILKDPLIAAKLQFAGIVTICLYYLYFSSPFYMYICVSQRFRRQFMCVFFRTNRKRRRQRISVIN